MKNQNDLAPDSLKKRVQYIVNDEKNITPQRKLVLYELLNEPRLLSAYDIQKNIFQKGHNLNISTIYRVLDFWISKGIVHKLNSNNTFMICHILRNEHVHVLQHCDSCNKVKETCVEEIGIPLEKISLQNHFKIHTGQVIETIGHCNECNKKFSESISD